MLPKGPTAAGEILPHPRLRLVDAKRDISARRQAKLIGPKTLIVDAVARFVENAKKGRVEEALVVTCRDPAVVRANTAAKRMVGDVQSAAGEIEANGSRSRFAERFLCRGWVMALQDFDWGFAARLHDCLNERDEFNPQFSENPGDIRGLRIGLVVVEQCVVWVLVVAEALGLLALEVKQFFGMWREGWEVIVFAGLHPCLLA